MSHECISRRGFIKKSVLLAGAAAVTPWSPAFQGAAKKVAASDLVSLGKTGLRISRLGFGTGSNGGEVQRALGQKEFTRLIHYAYDHGIIYIDTAENYETHPLVRQAIKGLPRERLWIQSKMWWTPENLQNPMAALERYRKELDTDYIDSLLIHCTMKSTWPQDVRPMMDAFDEARQRKLIRLKGMSCHGLPALRTAAQVDWAEVQLARVNPQGRHVDGEDPEFGAPGQVNEAMKEIKAIHAKGRGVIGMKLIGNGEFQDPADRRKAIQYAMTCGFVDAIVIGFASTAEIDEAIRNIERIGVAAA
jgi:predicted aldo/keto reductase-like oxidoreductase